MSTIIARFNARHEAEYACGVLEDAGIPAAVFADDAGATYPGINPAAVATAGENAGEARRVLVEHGLLTA